MYLRDVDIRFNFEWLLKLANKNEVRGSGRVNGILN